MHCPVCGSMTLAPTQLEPRLQAMACPQCGGVWIASSGYWAWLEQPAEETEKANPATPDVVMETPTARRCAGCGHIQLRYPIALDLPFHLDQCGNCNSFWLDRHEWAILRERGLHRQLHKITNTPWQRRLRQEQRHATWRQIYTTRFGAEDYAEIQRIRVWLYSHPEQAMLLAYLTSPDPYGEI
jgi:Zn-finger nucleic acid-binding protein